MKKLFAFAMLCAVCAGMASCDSLEQVQGPVTITVSDSAKAHQLDAAYDSLRQTGSRTLNDFRSTPGLNPDVTLVDSVFNETENQGGTTVYFKGVQVWKNSWNRPYMSQDSERTIVEHGYSSDYSLYFLRIVNNSVLDSGIGTEYKLFKIENGQWLDFNPDPEQPVLSWPIWGIQEKSPNEFIIKHGGGWARHPMPTYLSVLKDGVMQSFCLDCQNF